jgi:hypothetical protein
LCSQKQVKKWKIFASVEIAQLSKNDSMPCLSPEVIYNVTL